MHICKMYELVGRLNQCGIGVTSVQDDHADQRFIFSFSLGLGSGWAKLGIRWVYRYRTGKTDVKNKLPSRIRRPSPDRFGVHPE